MWQNRVGNNQGWFLRGGVVEWGKAVTIKRQTLQTEARALSKVKHNTLLAEDEKMKSGGEEKVSFFTGEDHCWPKQKAFSPVGNVVILQEKRKERKVSKRRLFPPI